MTHAGQLEKFATGTNYREEVAFRLLMLTRLPDHLVNCHIRFQSSQSDKAVPFSSKAPSCYSRNLQGP